MESAATVGISRIDAGMAEDTEAGCSERPTTPSSNASQLTPDQEHAEPGSLMFHGIAGTV